MLTSLKVYNPKGLTLDLPMNNTGDYLIKGISGLGPVKADILTTDFVGVDGGGYQGSKGNMRNVVILLGLNPSFVTEDPYGSLRRGLYSWFLPKALVEIEFYSDNFETVKLTGYVEDMVPSMFTEEPEVQVSILCPDPYFYSLIETTGSRIDNGTVSFINPGHATTGITVLIDGFYSDNTEQFMIERKDYNVDYPMGGLTIPTVPTSETMIYTGEQFASICVIKIDTTPGHKSVLYMNWYEYHDMNVDGSSPYIGPKGGWINVLGYLMGWIYINPGPNTFTVTYQGTETLTDQPTMYISFRPKYAGL